jgi:toxin FitB
MIVLDTNVLSETMQPAPNPTVIAWLNRQNISTLYITAVTLAELRFGIARLEPGRKKADLAQRLELMLDQIFEGRILPFTSAATQVFADRMAAARLNGRAVGFQDAMIAATVAAYDFIIATRDTRPFDAMGVPVINPWSTE